MCVTVRTADIDPAAPVYDRPNVSIKVSDRLSAERARAHVRLLLVFLGAPAGQTEPTCWCGDPVEIPAPRGDPARAFIPEQRGKAQGERTRNAS